MIFFALLTVLIYIGATCAVTSFLLLKLLSAYRKTKLLTSLSPSCPCCGYEGEILVSSCETMGKEPTYIFREVETGISYTKGRPEALSYKCYTCGVLFRVKIPKNNLLKARKINIVERLQLTLKE